MENKLNQTRNLSARSNDSVSFYSYFKIIYSVLICISFIYATCGLCTTTPTTFYYLL